MKDKDKDKDKDKMENGILPRITKILKIQPFKITILWNNAEIREIDFVPLFQKWDSDNNDALLKIKDYNLFSQASISESRTLQWECITVPFSYKGKLFRQPLELDPDVLYQNSILIRRVERIVIGQKIRKLREELGLTQTQVAMNSGTTKNYISRIENDQSDIQLDTLQKIIELGFGKKMVLRIE